MIRLAIIALTLFGAGHCWALDTIKPFVSGSMERIRTQYAGKPFIVVFWSVGCVHCPQELKALAGLKTRNPALNLVLVATDTPEDSPELARVVESYGLGKVEQWVFADAVSERLRSEIDRRWYGELPRTHLYDRQHKVEVISGVASVEKLERWVRESLK